MAEVTARERNAIPNQYKWNAESVFESQAAWEAELKKTAESLSEVEQYRGRLAEGPEVLAAALERRDALDKRTGIVFTYAAMAYNVDTRDQGAAGAYGRAQDLYGQLLAAVSFIEPELLAIGQETLARWVGEEPRLKIYAHYFDDLFRRQAHVRSAEVEELFGMLASPFMNVETTASMLTNADFKFPPARTADGSEIEVTEGTLERILSSSDREARRTAWENYRDTYLAFKNTLASNLITSVKQNVFFMRARRHPSTLAASLFENNIPAEVFHNLIATFRANIPTWHRYWALRRRALGVETLHPYDLRAPLTEAAPEIGYEQAVDWICEGLAPMGQDYVDRVRRGCLEDRWVDVFPNKGKTAGAFSSGSPGTFPFILMSHDDTVYSLSTLAHELGHSMHSYLTWQSQPMIYSNYSMFLAEVASNFHQAMVRAHLLESKQDDPVFQISLIEEAMSNFQRYFFIMPTLARFELEIHERIERGEGVSADDMIELMADLFSEGYGNGVHVDRARVGITWATFSHLYMDYYVYQYATGISGAHALAARILEGQNGAVEDYLNFLRAGNSVYPLEALRTAGVDLTTPAPVESAFKILAGMVDKLESLIDRSPAGDRQA